MVERDKRVRRAMFNVPPKTPAHVLDKPKHGRNVHTKSRAGKKSKSRATDERGLFSAWASTAGLWWQMYVVGIIQPGRTVRKHTEAPVRHVRCRLRCRVPSRWSPSTPARIPGRKSSVSRPVKPAGCAALCVDQHASAPGAALSRRSCPG